MVASSSKILQFYNPTHPPIYAKHICMKMPSFLFKSLERTIKLSAVIKQSISCTLSLSWRTGLFSPFLQPASNSKGRGKERHYFQWHQKKEKRVCVCCVIRRNSSQMLFSSQVNEGEWRTHSGLQSRAHLSSKHVRRSSFFCRRLFDPIRFLQKPFLPLTAQKVLGSIIPWIM